MIESLVSVVGQRGVDAAAFLLAFALTALTDSLFHNKLPHDHGREFAVNGGLSKGKARGSGLIFVLCIALVSLAFLPFRVEYVIYTVLLIASMLSGYFDDAAEKAWNEYKKGIIDFVIAVVAGVTYLNFNGCGVQFLQWNFTLPYAVYLLLIVILIWASINVVNCTDGVPAPVLTEPVLAALRPGSLIVDLASKPGGTDFAAAEELGLHAEHALALPGRCAPQTAGALIAQTVLAILEEHEEQKERSEP